MRKFRITLLERHENVVEVEADSLKEALAKAVKGAVTREDDHPTYMCLDDETGMYVADLTRHFEECELAEISESDLVREEEIKGVGWVSEVATREKGN